VLRSARRSHADTPAIASGLGTAGAFRQGLVSNLLNPKIAVFFTSLLPQFVSHGTLPALLALGALFNAMGLLWLTSYALLPRAAASSCNTRASRARLTT
jgi:threonine/homoserine/homoserine lactone efflux protein